MQKLNKYKLKDLCEIDIGTQLNVLDMIENGKYYVISGGREPSGYTDTWNVKENTISITNGGHCGYVRFNTEKFYAGGHCLYLTPTSDDFNLKYLYYFLRSKEKDIRRLRQGALIKHLSRSDVENLIISLPPLDEQNKIGNLLSLVDKKMELLEKILILYQKYFNKITAEFMQQNNNIVKLKDLCSVKKGEEVHKSELLETGKYYVMSGGKDPSGYWDTWNVKENTITIGAAGSYSSVNLNNTKFFCSSYCFYLTPLTNNFDLKYLYYSLKLNEKRMQRFMQGLTIMHMPHSDVENLRINLPSLEEQKKISGFLDNLKLNMVLNENKLRHLNEFKKGIFQKMFV